MKMSKKIFFLLASILLTNNLMAYNHNFGKEVGKGKPSNAPVNKTGCAPSTEKLRMQFNDVRAIIEPGGILFYDRSNNIAGYEVPKSNDAGNPNPTSIFAGALWMGGTDVNGQLKLAAQLYRAGVDF